MQNYYVMSLPDNQVVQELTKFGSNSFHKRYKTLFKQYEWYSEDSSLEQVLVNQSQIIVIYQNQTLSKTFFFILDFCDSVVFQK